MKRSKEMIGLDRAFRQVYAGDTVQDALGVKYTITERGTAAGPDGKEVEYHTLHGPELVGATEAKSAPKEAPEAVRSLHAYDDPKIGQKEPRKAPVKREPKPEKKEKKVGTPRPSAGRKNYSGLVRVGNITKAVGYNLGNGTAVLRDAGIEIVKDPVTGTPCVRIQDKDAARELLASLVPPAGAVDIETPADPGPDGIADDMLSHLKETPSELEKQEEEITISKLKEAAGAPLSMFIVPVLREVGIRYERQGARLFMEPAEKERAIEAIRKVLDLRAQPEPAPANKERALDDYTDEEIWKEMKRRGLVPAIAHCLLSDEDHVKALRDAGWTVTCTKSI